MHNFCAPDDTNKEDEEDEEEESGCQDATKNEEAREVDPFGTKRMQQVSVDARLHKKLLDAKAGVCAVIGEHWDLSPSSWCRPLNVHTQCPYVYIYIYINVYVYVRAQSLFIILRCRPHFRKALP